MKIILCSRQISVVAYRAPGGNARCVSGLRGLCNHRGNNKVVGTVNPVTLALRIHRPSFIIVSVRK